MYDKYAILCKVEATAEVYEVILIAKDYQDAEEKALALGLTIADEFPCPIGKVVEDDDGDVC